MLIITIKAGKQVQMDSFTRIRPVERIGSIESGFIDGSFIEKGTLQVPAKYYKNQLHEKDKPRKYSV